MLSTLLAVVGHRLSIISVISSTIVISGLNGTAYIQECFGLTSFTFLCRGLKLYFFLFLHSQQFETRETRLKFGQKEKINWIKPNLPLTTWRGLESGRESIKLNSPPLCRNNIKCNGSVSFIFIKRSLFLIYSH